MPRHTFPHRQAYARTTPASPLPHPSWTHGDGGSQRAGHQIEPSEFWQRLGL